MDAAVRSSPLGELDGRRVAAFCGIGNPEGFRRTLESLGGILASFRAFPDHHSYTAADVAELASWSAAAGADLVLTTQKDLVKLRAETLGPTPLRALRIGLEFLGRRLDHGDGPRAAPASGEMTPASPLRERIPRE